MKIVFVGNADSFWLKEFIEQVLGETDNEIFIISNGNKNFRKLYKEKGIEVLTYQKGNLPMNILEIFRWRKDEKKFLNQIGACDILHVQFVDMEMLIKTSQLIRKSKKIIYTFWGSDLLRGSKKRYLFFYFFLKKSNCITVMTKAMQSSFEKIYGKKFSQKTKILDFGNSLYDSIDKIDLAVGKSECKTHFGFRPDKKLIAVGYNAIVQQQHYEIMKELVKLPQMILYKIEFVFHFGYGEQAAEYRVRLENLLKENHINYKIIDRFLDKRETAMLRLGADIFIYGQTTDALSGSVLEYIYAGSLVIKPVWLDYSELYQRGIHYLEYERFEDLPGMLQNQICKHDVIENERIQMNRKKLQEMNSWQVLAPEWRKLYLLEEN